MSDRLSLDANFCPQCGEKIDKAEAVRTGEAPVGQGVYEGEDAHLVVEGDEIRIYQHAMDKPDTRVEAAP